MDSEFAIYLINTILNTTEAADRVLQELPYMRESRAWALKYNSGAAIERGDFRKINWSKKDIRLAKEQQRLNKER